MGQHKHNPTAIAAKSGLFNNVSFQTLEIKNDDTVVVTYDKKYVTACVAQQIYNIINTYLCSNYPNAKFIMVPTGVNISTVDMEDRIQSIKSFLTDSKNLAEDATNEDIQGVIDLLTDVINKESQIQD